jgi:hypothetical protein
MPNNTSRNDNTNDGVADHFGMFKADLVFERHCGHHPFRIPIAAHGARELADDVRPLLHLAQ